MYIIFKGTVNVRVPKIVASYKENSIVGRAALENNEPRSADL